MMPSTLLADAQFTEKVPENLISNSRSGSNAMDNSNSIKKTNQKTSTKGRKRRSTHPSPPSMSTPSVPVSLSLTVSLLTGSVGLSYDKVLRCCAVQFLCLAHEEATFCPARLLAVEMSQQSEHLRKSLFPRRIACGKTDAMGALSTNTTHDVSERPAAEDNLTKHSSGLYSIHNALHIDIAWVCEVCERTMRALLDVIAAVSSTNEEYVPALVEHIEDLVWKHDNDVRFNRSFAAWEHTMRVRPDGVFEGESVSTCDGWEGCCENDASCGHGSTVSMCGKVLGKLDVCCKLENLVRSLVTQVYVNICAARSLHSYITEAPLVDEKSSEGRSYTSMSYATADSASFVDVDGGFVKINKRQKKAAALYAQYRFIPNYCNLI